jgi:hypothetical protein
VFALREYKENPKKKENQKSMEAYKRRSEDYIKPLIKAFSGHKIRLQLLPYLIP